MHLRTLLLTLLIGISNSIYAQKIRVSGDVCNILTHEGVNRAIVKLMKTDSSTVWATDTTRYRLITEKGDNWENTYADKHSGAVFSFVVPAMKDYLLVVEAKGFEVYRQQVVPEAGKRAVSIPYI